MQLARIVDTELGFEVSVRSQMRQLRIVGHTQNKHLAERERRRRRVLRTRSAEAQHGGMCSSGEDVEESVSRVGRDQL